MSDRGRTRQVAAIGCGVLLTGLVIGAGVTTYFGRRLLHSIDSATDTLGQLNERFGSQADYVPPLDGRLARERVAVFLGVRQRLAPECDGFTGVFDQLEDTIHPTQETRPSSGRLFWLTVRTKKLPLQLAEYYDRRNVALLDAGMGLGEYTYLHVIAYTSWLRLRAETEDTALRRELGPHAFRLVHAMHRRQLGALETQPAAAAPDYVAALRREVARADAEPDTPPWFDGVPSGMAAALEPDAATLRDTFCAVLVSLELSNIDREDPLQPLRR